MDINDSQDGPMEGPDIRSCVTDGEERLRVWWKEACDGDKKMMESCDQGV